MKLTKRQFFKMSIVALAFGVATGVGVLTSGQPALSKHHVGLVEDWSSQRLIFSNPGSYEQAITNGTYSKWINLRYDNRFIMQQARRRAEAVSTSGFPGSIPQAIKRVGDPPVLSGMDGKGDPSVLKASGLHKDWSAALLTGTVLPNTFPAKWSFTTTGTPTCTSDFVVYSTGSTGSSTAATIIAYNNLYATTCSGAVPSVYWAYNTGAGAVTTSPTISGDGTQVAFIQVTSSVASLVLLKWNPNTTGRTVTGTVTSGSTSFTVSSSTPLTANDVGAEISGTGIPSGDTIASVTSSTAGTLATAATGSYSGETLTITAEAVGTPGVPPTVASTSYRSCTAPCMTTLTLSGSPNDTYSFPFYDYAADDALYVGDNSGKLHKFTGVFRGTPTENGTPWPVTLNASYDVSSPIYDPTSGCVFVGNTYGYLYSVNSGNGGTICTGASGTVYGTSENLGNSAAGDGIFDAPLVDSTAGMVYVFVAASAAIGNCSTAGSNCVYQFPTAFSGTSAVPNNEEPLGTGGANYNLYAGGFDNVYYSSSGSSPSGSLYVVGNTGATAGTGTLYRVPITSNAMGTPAAAVTGLNARHPPWPSPVTEFCNNGASACAVTTGGTCGTGVTCTTSGADYIFFYVYHGAETGCTDASANGCILDYTVNNPSSAPSLAGSINVTAPGGAGLPGCWGTGGFIIDNSSTSTGASQVYFLNLDGNSPSAAPTTCTSGTGHTIDAVQAAQSAL